MKPHVINLGFVPKNAEPDVRAIFQNSTARVLWCLWKRWHAVSQYFNGECVRIAARIDDLKPQTRDELRRCFPALSQVDFSDFDCDQFCQRGIFAEFFIPPHRPVQIIDSEGVEVLL